MLPELLETALVDIVQHASSASCDLAPFPHTVHLSCAVRLGLAEHVVVIVRFASCADEEGGAEQGCRRCSDLWDFRYAGWERCGVDEDLLVETVVLSAKQSITGSLFQVRIPWLPRRHRGGIGESQWPAASCLCTRWRARGEVQLREAEMLRLRADWLTYKRA